MTEEVKKKWICQECVTNIRANAISLGCSTCGNWYNLKCTKIEKSELKNYKNAPYTCKYCLKDEYESPVMQSKNPGHISSNGPGCASLVGIISQGLGSGVDARCNSDGTLRDSEPDSPDNFWKKLPDNALATLEDIYNEIVHWRSRHFEIYNNKVGRKFVDCINVALSAKANDTKEQKLFTLAAMTMPHMVLIRTKTMTTYLSMQFSTGD